MNIFKLIILPFTLLISISVFGQTDNNYYEQANEAYEAGEYDKSAALFVKEFDNPRDERTKMYAAYNAACAYSLGNNKKSALKYTKIALNLGMLNFEEDKDFDNIRNTGRFKKILKIANKKISELQSPPNNLPITYMPKGYEKDVAHPLIVILHGYGDNPANIMELYKPLADARGAILLSCRGSEIMSEKSFYWDYNNGEALTLLRRQVENTIRKFNVDKQKIMLTGFSQGGYLTYDFGLKNADLFTAMLPVAGRIPEKLEPHLYANEKLKIWSIAGLKESESFLSTYESLDNKLDKLKINYQLKFYNIGHQYPENTDEELLKAYDWLME